MEATVREPSPELAGLWDRIERGIAWLTEHDPEGSFHFWFKSGMLPRTPMPAQAAETREAWVAYYNQRVIWERLWTAMERLEKQEGIYRDQEIF